MLMHLEEELGRYVEGQERAIEQVARSVRRRLALGPPQRLLGAFHFVGPGSEDKERLARGLAAVLFGDEKAILSLDMTDFAERQTTASLIGYNGLATGIIEGRLTEPVRQRPELVVFLKDMDQAHYEAHRLLFQLIDEGTVVDGSGRLIDFTSCVLVMTTRLGAEPFTTESETRERIRHAICAHFAPEMLERIDDVVWFWPTSGDA
jgi:ATP-dependent Clp protease ATP-binding subunit ClpA